MARRCTVTGCRSTIGLHKFPNDSEVRRQWLRAIDLQFCDVQPADGVCNKHFARDAFANVTEFEMGFCKRLMLKSQAVPTLGLRKFRLNDQKFLPLEPKGTREMLCQTDPVITRAAAVQADLKPHWRSKAIQARAPGRSVWCDTWDLAANGTSETPRPFPSPVIIKKRKLSAEDSSNRLDKSANSTNQTRKQYVVHEDQLLGLFRKCLACTESCTVQKTTVGKFVKIKQLCDNCHFSSEWLNQPKVYLSDCMSKTQTKPNARAGAQQVNECNAQMMVKQNCGENA